MGWGGDASLLQPRPHLPEVRMSPTARKLPCGHSFSLVSIWGWGAESQVLRACLRGQAWVTLASSQEGGGRGKGGDSTTTSVREQHRSLSLASLLPSGRPQHLPHSRTH